MSRIIVIDEEDLRSIVRESVADALASVRPEPPTATKPASDSMTTREAAAYAKRSTATMRAWAKDRKVTARNHGGRVGLVFSRVSIDRHLTDGSPDGSPD